MESKRKKRKVRKVSSATPGPPKSPKPDNTEKTDKSAETLIRDNGLLVQDLYKSKVWNEIIFPLLKESVSSVCGRFTNGRYWHGGLTTKWDGNNSLFYSAYQKALMDFHNNLNDFVVAKNKLEEKSKSQEFEKSAPLYNPFMEDFND